MKQNIIEILVEGGTNVGMMNPREDDEFIYGYSGGYVIKVPKSKILLIKKISDDSQEFKEIVDSFNHIVHKMGKEDLTETLKRMSKLNKRVVELGDKISSTSGKGETIIFHETSCLLRAIKGTMEEMDIIVKDLKKQINEAVGDENEFVEND